MPAGVSAAVVNTRPYAAVRRWAETRDRRQEQRMQRRDSVSRARSGVVLLQCWRRGCRGEVESEEFAREFG
jgi:hypothetical protein